MQHPSIATQIWDAKYRLKTFDGTPVDQTIEDTWRRIANGLASVEHAPDLWAHEFYDALEDYKFLPAGRIISGTGTDRDVTLFNCFVMGTVPDSMSGIFDMLKEAALTMQQGGGIGYDFSTIRPKGAEVKGVAAEASGPLTFMDCWDAMCRTVMSAGERRGAMMATMRCDHPDIEDFIDAKRDSVRLRMFNLSVLVTDEFMEAVNNAGSWTLRFDGKEYKKVSARELWNKIIRTTYEVAEPGVIFIDRINKTNNLGYCETIAATNPCGEQPLPPYGACLLGSINLARLVSHPFEPHAGLDAPTMKSVVASAVRMLDNVVDSPKFPLEAQRQEALNKRRIGLGVTGVADALAMCGLKYGTQEAADRLDSWLQIITFAAYDASMDLAEEKGAFPAFDADGYLGEGTFASTILTEDRKERLRKTGIRNSHLMSIAPTGTISIYAGNVSSGIEPIFAYEYTRKVLQGDGSKVEETVHDYAVALYRSLFPANERPSYFTTAQELTPKEHLIMQASAQRWIDSSISKTINCPVDISFEDFKEVYEEAYALGCKGCTTYRPNAVTGSVLEVKAEEPEAVDEPFANTKPASELPEAPDPAVSEPAERPKVLPGETYKLKWPNEAHALYVTFTDQEHLLTGERQPFEMFINSKSVEHFAWTVALTRMVSAVFRRGGDVSFVARELQEVFDPKGGAYMNGGYVPSLLAAIGLLVEEHMSSIGYGAFKGEHKVVIDDPLEAFESPTVTLVGSPCRECGSYDMKREAGCETCMSCGASKCG